MKKIILTILAVFLSVNIVWAEENNDDNLIQLTDYRYDDLYNQSVSTKQLLYGYVLFNAYQPKLIDGGMVTYYIDNFEKIVPSTILKPDGTELFKSGKYYVKYYANHIVDVNLMGYADIYYPQNSKGNRYILCDFDTNKTGVVDENGNIIADFKYDDIFLSAEGYLSAENSEDNTKILINEETGKEILFYEENNTNFLLFNADNKKILKVSMIDNNDTAVEGESNELNESEKLYYYNFDLINSDGEIIESKVLPIYGSFEYGYAAEKSIIDEANKEFNDNYYKWGISTYDPYTYSGEKYSDENYYKGALDFIKYRNDSSFIKEDYKNRGYRIKAKKVNDKYYYAVFKELKDGEKEEDFRPKEQPSAWAKESVEGLTAEGLLFNEGNCRYGDNISRKDFAFVVVNAFCKAKGTDVSGYVAENNIQLDFDRFDDTKDAYVLLAEKLGILSGTSKNEFSPQRGITRQEAAVMLYNAAKLLGLSPNSEGTDFADSSYFAAWAKNAISAVSSIKNSDGAALMGGTKTDEFSPWLTFSREQAYTTIYRMYEMAK